ncbi:Endo-1,3(4)-beta-glucanase [Cladobotryum mycophilum]|uniref:Endo-1,3(4)-beta-glucanase n=1 Tax=Cladobotryum mycophilum TaxID=491253 RepID=A0ABR0SEN0_9HYPO
MHASTQLIFGLGALLSSGAQAQYYPPPPPPPPVLSPYSLSVSYDITNFFSSFDFFTDEDPTHGFVEYVDGQTANAEDLAGFANGGIYMGVDYKTKNPANGRKSVRVTSQQSFTHGLFIADIAHMPGSTCGGVSTQTKNQITLHTSDGCSITNSGTLNSTVLADPDCCVSKNNNAGCGQRTADNQNYGDGFNAIGGGVYATEWTSKYIAVWFFPRYRIPLDILTGHPNPKTWGPAQAKFNGGRGCNIDEHFQKNNIVFDTTFCGDWAGNAWSGNAECSALASTCKDYVSGNPSAFEEAYWVINSIKVYDQHANSTQPWPWSSKA